MTVPHSFIIDNAEIFIYYDWVHSKLTEIGFTFSLHPQSKMIVKITADTIYFDNITTKVFLTITVS